LEKWKPKPKKRDWYIASSGLLYALICLYWVTHDPRGQIAVFGILTGVIAMFMPWLKDPRYRLVKLLDDDVDGKKYGKPNE
jgi:hypothetical protein